MNFTCVPIAPGGDRYPMATASLSVRRTSGTASERGMRPAASEGSVLEEPRGGSDISSPAGGGAGVVGAAGQGVAPNHATPSLLLPPPPPRRHPLPRFS